MILPFYQSQFLKVVICLHFQKMYYTFPWPLEITEEVKGLN